MPISGKESVTVWFFEGDNCASNKRWRLQNLFQWHIKQGDFFKIGRINNIVKMILYL